MKRFLVALCVAATGGCYADYVMTSGGGYVSATIPVGPPPPISVSVAPPPPRYEPVLHCGYGQVYIPGYWDWNGGWYWVRGHCQAVMAGYSYVPPSYSGGVYIRGYWAPQGGGYVPPPAPAYQPVVPPPAPGVPPPPPAGGPPPPAPAIR
ncbi:MAG: hypothetical protein NZ890_12820 [Myxococcota bacterium]|nr:hypothetical protein [Myxococcota bacterium]